MNLTKAVVLLETRYKPVKEWPDGKTVPNDLPEDEELKKHGKLLLIVVSKKHQKKFKPKRQRMSIKISQSIKKK